MGERVSEARSDLRVCRDLPGLRVCKGQWAPLGHRAGHKALLVHQGLRGCPALLATRGTPELQDLKVSRAYQGLQERRETPDPLASRAQQEHRAPSGLRV